MICAALIAVSLSIPMERITPLVPFGEDIVILGLIESSYRNNLPVGPAGEKGILQITPPAQQMVESTCFSRSYMAMGVCYFNHLRKTLSLYDAVGAYNAGKGRIGNWPKTTEQYIKKFKSWKTKCANLRELLGDK